MPDVRGFSEEEPGPWHSFVKLWKETLEHGTIGGGVFNV